VGTYREAFADLRLDIIEQHAEGDVGDLALARRGTQRGALMGLPPTGRHAQRHRGRDLHPLRRRSASRRIARGVGSGGPVAPAGRPAG
jgi:hypothetical protein